MQGNLEREHPRGAAGNRRVRARRVLLRGEARAWQARSRGGGKDASVRASKARREGLRGGGAGLLAEVADANHQGVNS